MVWMQYAVHNGIVVYGGGDIVFGAKRSNQWMQCAVEYGDIWWWGHCLWCKKVKPVDAVDAVTQWTMSPTTTYRYSTASTVYCIHCVLWFDLFVPKTMSPPPYNTILLHTASTASTSLTFLHQRQCPYHHIPLFYCILHPLHPLV